MSETFASCSCGERFGVPESLKGGLANCPKCGKAATVEGGPEPLFWVLLAIGIAIALGISGALWAAGGPVAGGIALGVGAVIIAAIVAAS